MARITTIAISAALILLTAPTAQAQMAVSDGAHARACFKAAKDGTNTDQGMIECTAAIDTERLGRLDLAGTYVNRGVLHMRLKAYALARADFDSAIALEPTLGDAHIDRGTALIGEKRYKEGIEEIRWGLVLGSQEPAKAYFNRAMAYEALDNEQAAYADLVKASELAPNWSAPRNELKHLSPPGSPRAR